MHFLDNGAEAMADRFIRYIMMSSVINAAIACATQS